MKLLLVAVAAISDRALLARVAQAPVVPAPAATPVATPVAPAVVPVAPAPAATPVATPVAPAVVPVAAPSPPTVKLGLTVPGLRIAGSAPPSLTLGAVGGSQYVVGVDGGGALTMTHSGPAAPAAELLSIRDGRLHTQVPLQAGQADVQGFSVAGVPQWVLVARDDFTQPVVAATPTGGPGWTSTLTSSCGGVTMLGGYCNFAQGQVTRTLANLPPHSQIRVQATFHFIDRWVGETAYMKMDLGSDGSEVPVWTESHSQDHEKHGLNVCGQSSVNEGKFAQRIDVSVPHTKPGVKLSFGATMDAQDPCDESWGVSNVEVYIRAAPPPA